MKKWGFIYTLGDASAQSRTDTIGSAACARYASECEVSLTHPMRRESCSDGVELIELCVAFGGSGLAAVVSAVNDRVSVGAVFYGCEASTGLHRLFGSSP